jgi:hypothetical protein
LGDGWNRGKLGRYLKEMGLAAQATYMVALTIAAGLVGGRRAIDP